MSSQSMSVKFLINKTATYSKAAPSISFGKEVANGEKNKHARKRVKSLVEQNRYSTDSHFYDDLIYMDWPQTKDRFLNQVGR